jgi:hypothetical protein
VNRWVVVAPEERAGAWEGEVRLVSGRDTKTEACGHLHVSSAEAMRCSQTTVARRNHGLAPPGAIPAQRVPPDYYLG